MMPIDIDEHGVRSFAFVKDQGSCCFGQAPLINHWVYVTLKGGPFGRSILSRSGSSAL
ncbi:MAG: hypothetical protein IPJ35_09825 [Elusimicrobia bacterium]|nr:hypothetical protein [Elusimicrobiota bacterium]